jgi:16S rRNA processing protein RimM
MLLVGRVMGAHGIRGGLRVVGSEQLGELARIFLRGRAYTVTRVRKGPKEFFIELAEVLTRNDAEALRGAEVEAERSDLPALASDEVYVADLVGCAVVDGSDKRLGVVKETRFTGAQELLLVETDAGSILVPFVEPIVVAVDLERKRIVCDLPEGLPSA